MKQFLLFLSIFSLLSSCGVTRNQTRKQALREQEKTVKFKETWGSNYLSPNFQKIADTTYVVGIIVRTRAEPISEIVAEKLNELDKAAMELENSLVRNNFRVYDRAVYNDWESANVNLPYPFDLIIEIIEVQTTQYATGIKLSTQYPSFKKVRKSQYPHYLEGRKMLVKIVNAKNGEIAALVNCEYIPCRNGCKIIYNAYEILETTTLRGNETEEGDPEKQQYLYHMHTQLGRQVTDFIIMEMYRYKRKLNSK